MRSRIALAASIALALDASRCYAAEPSITLDASSLGRRFDGVGALSGGGATSRLLVDYSTSASSDIYDLLFKPMFGASMHVLKIEVGGDSFSGCGSEPSIEHTKADQDDAASFKRGYEGDVVRAALARNPSMLGYTLSWGFPGHLSGYLGSPLTNATSKYEARFCNGAKAQWGYTCDYTGIHNEMPWTVDYVKTLRRELDEAGLNRTQIVVADNGPGEWSSIPSQVESDPGMREATGVIGVHYPHASNSTDAAVATGIPLWSSEDSSSFFDAQGGACLARILNWNVLYGNMTSTIVWNLASGYLEQLHWYGDSLLAAAQPWSGSYYDASPLWAMAHWGQFAHPGYKFLHPGMGAGELPGGGTFVTLVEPSAVREQLERVQGLERGQRGSPAQERHAVSQWLASGDAYRGGDSPAPKPSEAQGFSSDAVSMDWVVVLETTTFPHSMCIRENPTHPWPVADSQDVTFRLGPGLSRPSSVIVWKTVFFASDGEPVVWFERQKDAPVSLDGSFTLSGIRPDSQYTIAARNSGQTHGKPATPPPKPTVFPVNWTEDFEAVPEQRMARYFSDQAGTFAATGGIPGAKGSVYLQNVTQPPSTWHESGDDPVFALSIGGRFDVADADVQVSAAILQEADWTSSDGNSVLSLRQCAPAPTDGGPPVAVPGDLQWVIDPEGVLNGSIANTASRKCLDVLGCEQAAGTPAWMWPCVDTTDKNCGSNNQLWDRAMAPNQEGYLLRTRMKSGLCLTAYPAGGQGTVPGAFNVTMQQCPGKDLGIPGATQVWRDIEGTGQLQAVGQSSASGKPMCLSAMPPGGREQASMVAVGVRLGGAAASNKTSAACAAYSSRWYEFGYWLFLQSNGTWILGAGTAQPSGVTEKDWAVAMQSRQRRLESDREQGGVGSGGAATQAAFGQQDVLASGSIPGGSPLGSWHSLRLKVAGSEIMAWVDGALVAQVQDEAYALGWVGIGSGYHQAGFDDWSANTTSLGLALELPPSPSVAGGSLSD